MKTISITILMHRTYTEYLIMLATHNRQQNFFKNIISYLSFSTTLVNVVMLYPFSTGEY